jgi:hypothetical protein
LHHQNKNQIDESQVKVLQGDAMAENRPEGMNTLVKRLDKLNVDVNKMADRRAKQKQDAKARRRAAPRRRNL